MDRAQWRQGSKKKKLIEAGEYWASAAPRAKNNESLQADFDNFGLTDEMREQIMANAGVEESTDFVVLPENAQALDVFLFCQSQWRTSMSGLTGLDYSAVISVISLRCKKRKHQNELLAEVRLIESGALSAISRMRRPDGKDV